MKDCGPIAATTFVRPLDFVTGAAFAWSLWLLRSTYTGYAFEARRSSDNATTNVSFDVSGVVSNSSLVAAGGTFGTWRGASTITIRTLYDHSGNACDLLQTTLANQPIYTDNDYLGRPVPRITSPRFMNATSTILKSINSCSIYFRIKLDNGTVANSVLEGGNGSSTTGLFSTLSNRFRMLYRSPYTNSGGDDASSITGNVPSGSYLSYTGVRDSVANNQIVYKNNTSVATLGSLAQPALPSSNMVMTYGGSLSISAMTGNIFAMIAFPYALTATQITYLDANI